MTVIVQQHVVCSSCLLSCLGVSSKSDQILSSFFTIVPSVHTVKTSVQCLSFSRKLVAKFIQISLSEVLSWFAFCKEKLELGLKSFFWHALWRWHICLFETPAEPESQFFL